MTNAIEVANRELFQRLAEIKKLADSKGSAGAANDLELCLEAYLELLRQDSAANTARIGELYSSRQQWEDLHAELLARTESLQEKYEALGQTADQRFRDLQLAEEANKTLQEIIRISGEELRHAQMLNRSYARQLAGTEESPALMTVLGALVDAQRIMTDWLVPDGVRARDTVKALLPVLDNQALVLAMREFEQPKTGE